MSRSRSKTWRSLFEQAGLVACILALISQTASGASRSPQAAQAEALAALAAAMVDCVPGTPGPDGPSPLHHDFDAGALCPLGASLELPPAILTPDTAFAPPAARAARLPMPPPRAGPVAAATSAARYPRGPPHLS